MTIFQNCPRCDTWNSFPDSVSGKIGRCKNRACRKEWRLTAMLPAVREVTSPAAAPTTAMQQRIERLGGLAAVTAHAVAALTGQQRGGVAQCHAAPLASPETLLQAEFICAVHDEPMSGLYTRRDGERLFVWRKGERGTHAIDRMCLDADSLQELSQGGGTVHYDRSITQRDCGLLSGFKCVWCGADDWFWCRYGCGALVCLGRSFRKGAARMAFCRRSCSKNGQTPTELEYPEFQINARSARLTYPALAAPQSGNRQLQNRSGSTSLVVRRD